MAFNWHNPYPTVRSPLFARNVVATSQPLAVQAGLAAACYAHDSARIGDGRDGFGHGLISAVNDAAAALGLRVGMSVVEGASRASGASA